jgi:hypothetical protein
MKEGRLKVVSMFMVYLQITSHTLRGNFFIIYRFQNLLSYNISGLYIKWSLGFSHVLSLHGSNVGFISNRKLKGRRYAGEWYCIQLPHGRLCGHGDYL